MFSGLMCLVQCAVFHYSIKYNNFLTPFTLLGNMWVRTTLYIWPRPKSMALPWKVSEPHVCVPKYWGPDTCMSIQKHPQAIEFLHCYRFWNTLLIRQRRLHCTAKHTLVIAKQPETGLIHNFSAVTAIMEISGILLAQFSSKTAKYSLTTLAMLNLFYWNGTMDAYPHHDETQKKKKKN